MRKIFLLTLVVMLLHGISFSQDDNSVQQPTLGIHFFLIDFKSASAVRSSSLTSAINNKQFGKVKEMSPGLALNYIKGVSSHLDISTTFAACFVDYPQQNRPSFGDESILLEWDASARAKIFSNRYWISPYATLGIGASHYKGYYGAFIPAGVGLQFNFFDEAYLIINSQYRIAVTQNTNYHFYHSIGLAGNIGRRKSSDQ